MLVVFNFYEVAALFEVFDYLLSRLVSIHARIIGIIVNYLSVLGQNVQNGQIVALADLEVVGIMRGGDLNYACTELHVNIAVGDNGYLSANERQDKGLANYVLVTLVLGVYGNCGIAQQSFGTGGSKLNVARAVFQRVAKMPEMTRLIFILYLGV